VNREAPHSTKSSIVCPIGLSESSHPIVKNLGGIKFDFANPIDTWKKWRRKRYCSSPPNIQKIGAPVEINLDIVAEETSPNHYIKSGNIPLALLLEGSFHSMFENRVLPLTKQRLSQEKRTNDCDFWRRFDKKPIDKNCNPSSWDTINVPETYDNKDFMLNCVNYLLDDTDLLTFAAKIWTCLY
jgi:hypothetical protein